MTTFAATLEAPTAAPVLPPTDEVTTVMLGAAETTVSCPACGRPATIEWRDTVVGTSGPVVHVKLRCPVGRHWFLMLEEGL